VYESCFGSFVYLTSKDWRECCILCAAGSDSPSEGEIAEAREALTCDSSTTVVNQYFTVDGNGRYERGSGDGKGADGGEAAAKGGDKGGDKPKSMFARNKAGGLASLPSLRPSMAGYESRP
jgi:hypothetical protein